MVFHRTPTLNYNLQVSVEYLVGLLLVMTDGYFIDYSLREIFVSIAIYTENSKINNYVKGLGGQEADLLAWNTS